MVEEEYTTIKDVAGTTTMAGRVHKKMTKISIGDYEYIYINKQEILRVHYKDIKLT